MANITLDIQSASSGAVTAVDALIQRMNSLSAALDRVSSRARIAMAPLSNPNMTGLEDVNRRIDELSSRLDEISKKGPRGLNNTGNAAMQAAKSASKASGVFGKLSKSIMRIAAYRLLRTAIKEIGKAFKEGLANAEAFSKLHGGPLAQSMDAIRRSAQQMKNQLGAALGGLLTAIAPVIIQAINLITRLADAVTQLLAAFGGQGQYKRAKEGLGDVESGASGAGKAIKGLLAPWDELNVIGQESGGGGGGKTTTNPDDLFEYADLDSWAQRIEEAFAAGNYFDVGAIIGERLNEAINNWQPQIDAQNISDKITGAFRAVSGFLQGTDWFELGRKIAEFINNINYTEIANSFFEMLGSAIGAIGSFLVGLFSDGIKELVDWWNTTAFENGEFTLQGLFDGISAAINNVAVWIWENVFKPFWDGICKAFDIHSPSGKMKEIGGYIIDGLFQPLMNIGEKFKTWWNEKIAPWFTKEKWEGLIKDAKEKVSNIFGGVKDKVVTLTAKVSDATSTVRQNIVNTWNAVKSKASELKAKVADVSSQTRQNMVKSWGIIVGKTSELKAKVADVASRTRQNMVKSWGIIVNKASTLTGKIVEGTKSTVRTALTDAWSTLKNSNPKLAATISETGKNVREWLVHAWKNVSSKVATLTGKAKNDDPNAISALSLAWSNIKTVTATLTAKLSATNVVETFIKSWNALKDKALDLKVSFMDNVKSKWNNIADKWNGNTGLVKIFGRLPKLATGGLAYGTTLAMVGEYSGARNNPEVIAPLSDLKGILASASIHTNSDGDMGDMVAEIRKQNNLIETQNGLIRELLNKEVTLKPSVALGQVVSRSSAMYART